MLEQLYIILLDLVKGYIMISWDGTSHQGNKVLTVFLSMMYANTAEKILCKILKEIGFKCCSFGER